MPGCQPGAGTGGYATWESIALDTQASIWLVETHIAPGQQVAVRPQGAVIRTGITFAFADADYRRTASHTAFTNMLAAHALEDPVLQALANTVDNVEIAPWRRSPNATARNVEIGFRALQTALGGRPQRIGCFTAFFDAAYAMLANTMDADQDTGELPNLFDAAMQDARCDTSTDAAPETAAAPRLPTELQLTYILKQIAEGRDVRFVDVREAPEFAETRVPGAINLKLREVNADSAATLADADLVIAYCIKDFRGFEVGKALAEHGVWPVGTMSPHGLAGWRAQHLPTASDSGPDDATAFAALLACARGEAACQ